MGEIAIGTQQVLLQPGVRPKAGAVALENGDYADADKEVFVTVSVAVIKKGPQLLDKSGQQHAVAVPIAIFFRPYLEVEAMALQVFSAGEQAARDELQ